MKIDYDSGTRSQVEDPGDHGSYASAIQGNYSTGAGMSSVARDYREQQGAPIRGESGFDVASFAQTITKGMASMAELGKCVEIKSRKR